ncbi:hypothetical protein ACFLQL_00685 [Verrucomicrobiota bacterium]
MEEKKEQAEQSKKSEQPQAAKSQEPSKEQPQAANAKKPVEQKPPRALKREAEIIAGEYKTECARNLTEIIKKLKTDEELTKLAGTDTEIIVNLVFSDVVANEPDRQPIGKGKYDELLTALPKNVLTAGGAVEMLRHFCIRMIETSNLKAAMFTLLFDQNEEGKDVLGGLGIVNENVEILPEHITKFVKAADGQLEMFKDAMKKKGFKFPDDSNIIIPGH